MSYNRLQSIPLKNILIQDKFWEPRLRINREITLPLQYRRLEEKGHINNFRRASGKKQIDFEGMFFNDSDVYKWLEAVSYSLESYPDEGLQNTVNELIDEIAAFQDEDGYLNSYFTFEKKSERWTDLEIKHELYCAGHFFEAAVAHFQATGERKLLDVAIRLADHICDVFGPDRKAGVPGHEEIELALVKLYRVTGFKRFLDLAEFFIKRRGEGLVGGDAVRQDHMPVEKMEEIVGHAVCATYLMSGTTDVYSETGNEALLKALNKCWHSMVERRMYITGSIGSRYEGEAFGKDYELPNDRAYNETCAAIGNIFWNHRMLQLTGKACYADVMETIMYNGFLSGLSLDGKKYFYVNPLRDNGEHRRQDWFGVSCCPPNIARFLSSLGKYLYSYNDEEIWLHHYVSGSCSVSPKDDSKVKVQQKSNFPWNGEVEINVSVDRPASFTLYLRIPHWCSGGTVTLNNNPVEIKKDGGYYLAIKRDWQNGDTIKLNLPMSIELLESHPHNFGNHGQLAIRRGPLVYCVEAVDHPGIDLFDIQLHPDIELSLCAENDAELGEINVIQGQASVIDSSNWQAIAYRKYAERAKKNKPVKLTAIPYYAWANRAPGKMQVWIPKK